MKALWIIAMKEVQNRIRNRWVLTITLIMAGLALGLVFLGSTPTGSVGASPLAVIIVSLSSLSIFLIPLTALLLSHDAIVGEMESGALLLLITYPVSRWAILLGKFTAHCLVITFTTVLGYGSAGIALLLSGTGTDARSWPAFAALLGTSTLLGWVFAALGMGSSVIVRERAAAIALSIGLWLFFVLLFDLALLGLLASGNTWLDADSLQRILLFNPTDIFRLFNLGGFEEVRAVSGMVGLTTETLWHPHVLVGVMILWILIPLALSILSFSRKEI